MDAYLYMNKGTSNEEQMQILNSTLDDLHNKRIVHRTGSKRVFFWCKYILSTIDMTKLEKIITRCFEERCNSALLFLISKFSKDLTKSHLLKCIIMNIINSLWNVELNWTILTIIVKFGEEEFFYPLLKYLPRKLSDIENYVDNVKKNSILHLIAENGDLKLLQFIINRYQVDVLDTNNLLETPLHLALANRHVDCAKLLISIGKEKIIEMKDRNYFYAIYYITKYNFIDLLKDIFNNYNNENLIEVIQIPDLLFISYGHPPNLFKIIKDAIEATAKDCLFFLISKIKEWQNFHFLFTYANFCKKKWFIKFICKNYSTPNCIQSNELPALRLMQLHNFHYLYIYNTFDIIKISVRDSPHFSVILYPVTSLYTLDISPSFFSTELSILNSHNKYNNKYNNKNNNNDFIENDNNNNNNLINNDNNDGDDDNTTYKYDDDWKNNIIIWKTIFERRVVEKIPLIFDIINCQKRIPAKEF